MNPNILASRVAGGPVMGRGGATDTDIKIIRALAVVMIFICHILEAYGHFLAWWLSAGVQAFLFLSGFMFGGRTVDSWRGWFGRRLGRILPPVYLLIFAVAAAHYLCFKVNLIGPVLAASLLCVQEFLGVTLPDCHHLWFIGLILLCYLSVPGLQWLRGRVRGDMAAAAVFFVGIPCALFLIYKLIPLARYHYVADLSVFAWGYYFASRPEVFSAGRRREAVRWGSLVVAAALLAGRGAIEYFGLTAAGPFGMLYDKLFLPFSKAACGVALFFWIYGRGWGWGAGRLVEFIDTYSYEIYLVHHPLMFGAFSVLALFPSRAVCILLAIVVTAVAAVAMKRAVAGVAVLSRRGVVGQTQTS